ncbi:MAG: hypothetical protein NTV88_00550 [Candidatus Micrarchaeota archaeon]|nr:hypothetical protein [Candidatus Micrarchaeota archaeon]
MADELEEKLQGKLGEKYDSSVEGKIAEFGGLLTRRAAIRLLCKENGIDTEKKIVLSAAVAESLPFSFSGKVDRIFPVQIFASGERCVRLHLSDVGGQGTLVLWGSQTSLIDGEISIGDEIECKGAYVRSGEIHLGREGKITHAKKFQITPIGKLAAGICSTEGEVREIFLDYDYTDKKTGAAKKMASFLLCAKGSENCLRVVMWSAPQGTPKPVEGDFLLLENVVFKNNEAHFNSFSRMVRKVSAQEKTGEIVSVNMDVGGEGAIFRIGKESFALPISEALALLGIKKVPEGVEPATILAIKSEGMKGKTARYRLSEGKICWLALQQ